MRLSISRTLFAIFVLIGLICSVTIGVVGDWVQNRAVNSLAHGESRRHAELIFQNLYSVMRKGWTKDEIRDLVHRLNQTNPDLHVSVYRSAQVAADFGEIEQDLTIRTTDPMIAKTIAEGQENLYSDQDRLRFVYPILVSEDCVSCHVSAAIGSVNGVIDIQVPLEKLRVPLEFTIQMVVGVFAGLTTLLFLLTLVIVRQAVAKPIAVLAKLIDQMVAHGDLGQRIDGRAYGRLYELRGLGDNFNRLMDRLQASQTELIRQSSTDPLTGLSNRRFFSETLLTELERAKRYRHDLSVIMIDLDGFKPINDQWGHAAGDDILRAVSSALRQHVRASDVVARLGGDEFAVLAPECNHDAAMLLSRKLTKAIEDAQITVDGHMVGVGASIGIGNFPAHGMDETSLLSQADEAMYYNKRQRKASRQERGKVIGFS